MSDPHPAATESGARIALVGATGLVGRKVIEVASAGDEARIIGIARREAPLPPGARMEMFVAEPVKWAEVLDIVRPRGLICALGTTWKKAGRDEAAFRSVDYDLMLAAAAAAKLAGATNMVLVSAAGADARSKSFYVRVKGEAEDALAKLGFNRLDILHPGLLRGSRQGDLRLAERAALIAARLVDPLLSGKWERFRSIDAALVAEAALGLALRRAGGRFTHDNEGMRRAAREWRRAGAMENAV